MEALALTPMQDPVGYFVRYLTEERMLGSRTIARYRDEVHRFAEFLKELPAPPEIGEADKKVLVTYLRRPTSAGKAPSQSTWNNRLAALRALYEFLFQEEVITVNPALRIERQRVPRPDRLPLSLDEVLALVDAAGRYSPEGYAKRNVALVQVFFHCALRVAEVVSLDLDQVDFENRVLLNVRTKGNKRLSVLFNDVVTEALEAYLIERGKILAGGAEAALFLSRRQRRLSVRAVENLVKHYAELAGISRPVSPHLLRHASATELAEFVNLRVVQEHCGHASVTTTERYVHVNRSQRRRAVDSLGECWRESVRRRRKPSRTAKGGSEATV